MVDSLSDQEKAFQEEKANCLFCKIVAGEIPSRKVYEDDNLIAIMDINPAVKGHVLVIPKEHYPILPVIPFPVMQAIFKKTLLIARKVKEAMLSQGVTVFIANGAVAGQRSPHFLFHIIPRESNDKLTFLFSPENRVSPGDQADLLNQVKPLINKIMLSYLSETNRQDLIMNHEEPLKPPKPPSIESSSSKKIVGDNTPVINDSHSVSEEPVSNEDLQRLINVINSNSDLRDAIIERPDEVKRMVATNEKWRSLFKNINIDQLSNNLKIMLRARIAEQEVIKKQQQSSNPLAKPDKADLDKISKLLGDNK